MYLCTSLEIARGQRGELNSRQLVNVCALRGKGGLEEGSGRTGRRKGFSSLGILVCLFEDFVSQGVYQQRSWTGNH